MDKDKSIRIERVGDLFETYRKRLKPPQASVEKECKEIINEVLQYKITEDQITYNPTTRTVSLQLPSIIRAEIKMHTASILKKLQDRLGEQNTPKVIL